MIEQNINDTFQLQEDGGPLTVTLTEGNYTRKSLLNELTTQLNNIGSWTYTVALPDTKNTADDNKFTFTVSGNTSQPSFIIPNTTISKFLGFNRNTTYNFSADSLKSVNPINMQAKDIVFLKSNMAESSDSSQDVNTLAEIFASLTRPFSNIHYSISDPNVYSKKFIKNGSNIFKFLLEDSFGETINLNGANLHFTILLYKDHNNVFPVLKDAIKINMLRE
jgi:hypothetical protein